MIEAPFSLAGYFNSTLYRYTLFETAVVRKTDSSRDVCISVSDCSCFIVYVRSPLERFPDGDFQKIQNLFQSLQLLPTPRAEVALTPESKSESIESVCVSCKNPLDLLSSNIVKL